MSFWAEVIFKNLNALLWVYIGYRICKRFMTTQYEDRNKIKELGDTLLLNRRVYKACKEFEFKHKCRTMIDYEDSSMIRVYKLPNNNVSDMKMKELKEMIERRIGSEYKGLIVRDDHLQYCLDEHEEDDE